MSGLADWIEPARTALLVVDFQVDFAAPEGRLGQWGADLSTVPAALAAAQRLVRAARKAGVLATFVGMRTTPDADSPAWAERIRRRGGDPRADLALCRAGEPGAAFVGPQPQDGDLVIAKTRFSGFFDTPLDQALRQRRIDTLVVCGMTTECCVDCTVRDAFHLDYQVFLAGDACAAYEPDLHAAALKGLDLSCAMLVTADQVARAWSRPGQS
jgi:nicotinamidase-related amidase